MLSYCSWSRHKTRRFLSRILSSLADGKLQPRPALATAFFDRIAALWKDLRPETQLATALRLFDMSFSEIYAAGSRGVLHAVTLPTEVLAAVLDHSIAGLAQMQTETPSKKRRRTSHGRESIPQDATAGLEVNEARLTFALEVVENSKVENHPHLLAALFEVLIVLRRLKDKNTSESPYLLNLCLSSILAIVDKAQQSRKPNIDMSSIRADLVTDCVRSSENPQVQSTALLLSASLASLAPDRILHTIMPIFTFMGKSILSKDDERSIFVTNRTIDAIIPPLVASLKKHDAKNLIQSTSSLLSSFVTAYEHVPHHRRVAFYQRLLTRLGADDFSFAVIALLASRRRADDLSSFFADLIADFTASTQLLAFRKLVDLSNDVFANNPHNAESLLDITKKTTIEKREEEAIILLDVAAKLLDSRSLKARVKRLSRSEEAERELFWAEFKASISRLLGMLKTQKTQNSTLLPATKSCLSALLELLSLADLIMIMPDLLNELAQVDETQDLLPVALRVLASQLGQKTSKDSHTQAEAISVLPTLETIIKTTEDVSFRHSAIQCLDRIVELYGRKNPDAVITSVTTLIEDSPSGLDSKDEKTQIMSLLCLATAMEVLKEGGVPIVLAAMPKVLRLVNSSLDADSELHTACYTLIASFVTHVPFTMSDEDLVQILDISYRSCRAMGDNASPSRETRLEMLRLIGQKLELSSITSSLSTALGSCVVKELKSAPIMDLVDMFRKAVENSSKATVVKSAEQISTLILQGFGLRGYAHTLYPDLENQGINEISVEGVQSAINSLAISFIYKLNDTTFRPIFESWVDWAVNSEDDAPHAKYFRLYSFFAFAAHFFGVLTSIVTSYASYVLHSIIDVLQSAVAISAFATRSSVATLSLDVFEPSQFHFWELALNVFKTMAVYDADGFFTSPAHFQPLADLLVAQYTLLSNKSQKGFPSREDLSEHIGSALISLATCVQDVPAHHHTINHLLCELRRSESPHVRLASITAQITLTLSGVGDEWVQNVVLGQASGEGGAAVGGGGETMIYVNEILEDDDEGVEGQVRRWVGLVREKVGEDVFEV